MGSLQEFINNDHEELNSSDKEFIKSTILDLAPIDFELLGIRTVDSIINKDKFEELPSGRHLELVESIGFVSAITSLVQYSYNHYKSLRVKYSSKEKSDDDLFDETKINLKKELDRNTQISIKVDTELDDPANEIIISIKKIHNSGH